ncbi:ABC transporter permease [Dyadobacter frigoris]|uniref:Transport permease protein n=1 Tax=Dyadobacter frigoris TaxID=2576211 RepID=A0A4U6DCB2_9BACT|nr:ABC transporter permease [Dyadobacter frigoris]TKT94131.1 ABC transporter permease [Dyadobacter frigoris]GLU50658.1 transport permease protein [Dyadobacter frigoris]
MSNSEEKWDLEIIPYTGLFDINWRELWQYRDLIFLFVRRDVVATYKQTILGPLWFFIQPMLTTLMYVTIFGNMAKISTGGSPKILFYLGGITVWNYFQECLLKTSETFIANQNLFGKVYFPRMVTPISIVISSLLKFFIQFSLFLITWLYFLFQKTPGTSPNITILLFPLYIILMSGLGFSFGILISSLTTRYRDLRFLVQFGIQLLMYATPIVYPLEIASEKYRWLLLLNPITSIVEAFRYAFTSNGNFSSYNLIYSTLFMTISLFFSIIIFNRVEKTFMDKI